MAFLEAMKGYYEAEKSTGKGLFIFGFVIGAVCLFILFRKWNQALFKGMFFPLALLCAVSALAGPYLYWNNQRRLEQFPVEYQGQQKEFIEKELERFDGRKGVNSTWIYLKSLWAVLFLTGIIAIFVSHSNLLKGIALGLMMWACFGMVVDTFAEDRARDYAKELQKQWKNF